MFLSIFLLLLCQIMAILATISKYNNVSTSLLQLGSPWPMLKRNQFHNGISPFKGSEMNTLKWKYSFGVVIDGVVDENILNFASESSTNFSSVSGSGIETDPYIAESTNDGIDSSTAELQFVVTKAGTVTINATVSSEEGYDFAYVIINGDDKWTSSNSGENTFTLESYDVNSGDIIKFQYISIILFLLFLILNKMLL